MTKDVCKARTNRNVVEKHLSLSCLQCGNALPPKRHKYCSNDCGKLYTQIHRTKNYRKIKGEKPVCKNCGNTFIPINRNNRQFCSTVCRDVFWKNERRVKFNVETCVYCGKEFNPHSSNTSFCSYKCGIAARRDAEYFDGMRRTAIGFNTKQCWVCGKVAKRINVHHVVKRNLLEKDPFLVVLCRGCHQLVTMLGDRVFINDPEKLEDLITLARFCRTLPNARTKVTIEEI